MTIDEARQLLKVADVVIGRDWADDGDNEEEKARLDQTINMNDTWGWALSWCQHIEDEELIAVAKLFKRYGKCGLYYWMTLKHPGLKSEFEDINRMVEFVRQEEAVLKEYPNSSQRAYQKVSYTIR